MEYNKLFTPFKIGSMEVKNRIVFSPIGINVSNIDGTISDCEINYYEERARGGVGMIIMGAQFLSQDIANGSLAGILEHTYVIPQLTTICEVVQRYGTKIVAQLCCGTGRDAFPNIHGESPMSASPIPSTFNPEVNCRPMSYDDIQDVMKKFAFSAKLVKDAGFDAIEIHGHTGDLIDQFMSPIWNKREDKYGGTDEKRARFPREIVRSIRNAVGVDIPIIFRISLDHRFEGGRTLEDSMNLIKLLEEEGIDAIDIDAGSSEAIDYVSPSPYLGDACMEYVCEPARRSVKIPILNSGNHTPETAARLIESRNADFVMFGRPLIADPEMPNKLMNGNREDVCPCIRCNECLGRVAIIRTKLNCSVNPQVCDEVRFQIKPTKDPKNVVVIGAGPAGLEAARVAAIEGHKVTLFEKETVIGGQLAAAATPAFKSQLRGLIDWYGIQLKKLGVDLQLGKEVAVDAEILASCEKIIVGTGAVPAHPPIPGIDGSNVINIIEAHKNKELLKGENIVICGGGLSGCDMALELATEGGKKVTIVEMADVIAKDAIFVNAASLIPMLAKAGVKIYTKSKVTSIDSQGVYVQREDDDTSELIEADNVIIAFGMRKNNKLAEEIKAKYHIKTRIIGDCEKVGKVGTAVHMGFFAALSVE